MSDKLTDSSSTFYCTLDGNARSFLDDYHQAEPLGECLQSGVKLGRWLDNALFHTVGLSAEPFTFQNHPRWEPEMQLSLATESDVRVGTLFTRLQPHGALPRQAAA